MRVEYGFELSQVEVPRFSVEVVEGIGKLFTLATLVLNVLDTRPRIELVFHGLNREDPEHCIEALKQVVNSSQHAPKLEWKLGHGGPVRESSSYFQWVTLERV